MRFQFFLNKVSTKSDGEEKRKRERETERERERGGSDSLSDKMKLIFKIKYLNEAQQIQVSRT